MKKLNVMLGCVTLALAACGIAACGGDAGRQRETHTVAFESAWGGVSDTQTIVHGGKATRPDDPSDPIGWTFDGWYLGDVEYTFTEEVRSDITLVAKYSSVLGGSGTQADPFTIDNADELVLLKGYIDENATEFISAVYVQTADITSALDASIAEFTGVYDGGGKTLTTDVPLFDSLSGTVKDLKIVGDVTGTGKYTGIVANTAEAAEISRVSVQGSVTNANGTVGGVVGAIYDGSIEYVESSADVSGKVAGGIVGENGATIINSTVAAEVVATQSAGGIVGEMLTGALAQNVGFGSDVTSANGIAGGIVGSKSAGSSVYRGFVYGDGSIGGKQAGGIVGKLADEPATYTDVTDSYILATVTVNGTGDVTNCFGSYTVQNLDDLTLPDAVWSTVGDVPVLRAQIGNIPSSVKLNVDGTDSSVVYGFKLVRGDYFDMTDAHFSNLIRIDTDVTLQTAKSTHEEYGDSAFTAAYSEIEFTQSGISYKPTQNATATKLSHVITYAHTETFTYTPDYSMPNVTQEIDYAAPVSVYTDGNKYYAFTVEKQQIQSGYVAFLESYELNDGEWTHSNSWYPKADLPVGAYTYTTAFALGTTMQHLVLIGGDYTVEDDFGYYLTRYVSRTYSTPDEPYTEGDYTVGHGYTVMFLGNSENNEHTVAFAFEVNYEGYVDFIYIDGQGKWVSSTGSPVTDATSEFLGGVWFDGTDKYAFDTENNTVSVLGGTGNSADYTVTDGVISFTLDKKYELTLAPTLYGACMLVSRDGSDVFSAATYISGAFDGKWITEDGDVIVVSSEPAASVTFNGRAAQANEALYNGVQAVRFTQDSKEYHLVTFREDGIALLYLDNVAVYAFNAQVISELFTGSFVSVADGVRYELEITDDLTVTLKDGGAAVKSGKATPTRVDLGEFGLDITIGSVTYKAERTADVIAFEYNDKALVFTAADIFARFVGEYTKGTEMLEITENGTFARYDRGGSAESFTKLTAKFRAERVTYGREDRGFVLSYMSEDTEYFFYADVDARNIRLYRSFVNSSNNETAREVCAFVPQSELASIFGGYTRTFNDAPDTLVFGNDYTLKRTYTDNEEVEHTDEEISWYPLLNYNYNTRESSLTIYTTEIVDGAQFDNNITFTLMGLTWGFNSYLAVELADTIDPYIKPVYINGSTSITVGAERITVNSIAERTVTSGGSSVTELYVQTARYAYDSYALDGDTVTLTMTETGVGITDPRTATAVLTNNGGERTVTFTVGADAAKAFVGEAPLDYNTLKGEYKHDGTTYAFTAEELWGSVSIVLELSGTIRSRYNYAPSNGSTILKDGTQALAMGRVTGTGAVTLYVWKDGDYLMVSDSLDPSGAIAATDAAIENMPSIDELKEMLDGNEYVAADGSTVTFNNVSGGLGGGYFEIVNDNEEYSYLDDEGHTVAKGVYTLVFGVTDLSSDFECYVKVYINDVNAITKLLIGETLETATTEYLPGVSYPSVTEILEALNGVSYKAADGEVISFSKSGSTYSVKVGGTLYDYVNNSGVLDGGVYTMSFKYIIGGTKVVTVTYATDGVVKVSVDGKDYLPVQPPTMDELQESLNGAVFTDGTGKWLTFEKTSGFFASFNISLYNGDSNVGNGIYDSYTQDGNAYVLTFDYLTPTVRIEFNANGEVSAIIVDGITYTALPTAEELLKGLDGMTFVNSAQDEMSFEYYAGLFGGPATYSVCIGDDEYDLIESSGTGMTYTVKFESSSSGTSITLVIEVGYDGTVTKITYNGSDYTLKAGA